MREHVSKALLNLRDLLGNPADVDRAKAALAKHVGKLVLTPGTKDGRPVYGVSGAVSVDGGGEKCRMLMVARDGIGVGTGINSA